MIAGCGLPLWERGGNNTIQGRIWGMCGVECQAGRGGRWANQLIKGVCIQGMSVSKSGV